MSDYAFTTLGLHRVEAGFYGNNQASQRAFCSAGFVEDGRRRERRLFEGIRVDEVIMGRLRDRATGHYSELFLVVAGRQNPNWMQRLQYRWADALVAVTPQLQRWLRLEGCTNPIEVVPNGANLDYFNPGLSKRTGLPPRYVVFFGGFAAGKASLQCLMPCSTRPGRATSFL